VVVCSTAGTKAVDVQMAAFCSVGPLRFDQKYQRGAIVKILVGVLSTLYTNLQEG